MTLVLFDEADSLLDTDKGFLAALPGLIRESRRPIVLCLNDSQLPQVLLGVAAGVQVQQAMLLRPPGEELLRLLVLVLAAEERQGFGLEQVRGVMAAHVSAGGARQPCMTTRSSMHMSAVCHVTASVQCDTALPLILCSLTSCACIALDCRAMMCAHA